jgi:hypothetical protein
MKKKSITKSFFIKNICDHSLTKDSIKYTGDDGNNVFDSAACNRVVCLETKKIIENVKCVHGKFDQTLPSCGIDHKITQGDSNKAISIDMGRLGYG